MAYRSDHSLFLIFLSERERVASDKAGLEIRKAHLVWRCALDVGGHRSHCSQMKLGYGGMGEVWLSLEGLPHLLRCTEGAVTVEGSFC